MINPGEMEFVEPGEEVKVSIRRVPTICQTICHPLCLFGVSWQLSGLMCYHFSSKRRAAEAENLLIRLEKLKPGLWHNKARLRTVLSHHMGLQKEALPRYMSLPRWGSEFTNTELRELSQ